MEPARRKRGFFGALGELLFGGVRGWIVSLIGGVITIVILSALAFPPVRTALQTSVCQPDFMQTACRIVGVSDPADPAALAAAQRDHLLTAIAGRWGRQDRPCSEGVIEYVIEPSSGGETHIAARAPDFERRSQVIAAEGGVLIARETTDGARDQWEFRPEGDRMTIIDKDGVATELVRC